MDRVSFARVGAVLASADPYSAWYGELLRQTGLVCEIGSESILDDPSEYDVLILCGQGKLTGEQRKGLAEWLAKDGRHVVVTGGFWHGEYLFDIAATGHKYCRCHLCAPEAVSVLAEDCFGGLFFGGEQAKKLPGEVLALDSHGNPLVSAGSKVSVFAPHAGMTGALMAMGRGVSTDLVGPCDGSCYTQDGVLRAEDGTVFLWSDRAQPGEGLDPAFLTPHLDMLREQFLRLVLAGIGRTGLAPALVWHLPENHNVACTVDVECDSSLIDHIKTSAALIARFGLRAAWMVPPPGLPLDVYRTFKSWGHDIGHLYKPEKHDASTRQVKVQNTALTRGVGSELKVMKGWDGAWFGLTRMYALAEETGAVAMLSKGGRQPGTAGFLFGTGRPFVPVTHDAKFQVVEIPAVSFAPGWVTPFQTTMYLAQRIQRFNGTFRFDFLTSHAAESRFELNLPQMLRGLIELGYKAFSPSELAKFELARRRLSYRVDRGQLTLKCGDSVRGLTLLVGADAPMRVRGHQANPARCERYGREWAAIVFDLDARLPVEVEADPRAVA
ncbi:MAG: hypothetical protein JSS71_03145 [Armatimonadetes bacterium]|nr:hypothetical protein [Armatimonadota bacterium]MBX3108379.1 hypothetical protein [Fimbriimonadaceae bacterium]